MLELADYLFIGLPDLIQFFRRRRKYPGKFGLGNNRHDVHDKGPQLSYLSADQRDLIFVHPRYVDGIYLDSHTEANCQINPRQLVFQKYCRPFNSLKAPAVVLYMAVYPCPDGRITGIDGYRQAMEPKVVQEIDLFRQK